MHHGAKTASRAGAPKKLFAGIAALGLAAGAYGVYATTLTVNGVAGTALQAGSADAVVTSSCQTAAMTVTENFTDPEFSATTGYPVAERTGWTISGIQTACAGHTIALAVESDAAAADTGEGESLVKNFAFVEVGSLAYNGATLTFLVPDKAPYSTVADIETAASDTQGYSIKISKPAT